MTVVSHTQLYQRGFRDGLLQAEKFSLECALSLGKRAAPPNVDHAVGAEYVALSLRVAITKVTM